MPQIDIADLDCIYLCYDEPQKDEFWAKIKNMVPWATRVDGIKGSDAAHKAAADASTTERFILIDGDNLPNTEFFNLTLDFSIADASKAVFRWRAQNYVNALRYGNGGLSSWTREFAWSMRTHEHTDGRDETTVEFCFDPLYWAMYDCYSTTFPNGSPKQAWRAGFREGVKMCLDRGRKPSVAEFRNRVHQRNLDHLTIWHNVGLDVDQGAWAIAGSRQGTYMTMLSAWDHSEVQDFDALDELWRDVQDQDPAELIKRYKDALATQLDLPMNVLMPPESKFFKHHYRSNWHNRGVMVREIDVIRQQEGW